MKMLKKQVKEIKTMQVKLLVQRNYIHIIKSRIENGAAMDFQCQDNDLQSRKITKKRCAKVF